MDWQSCSYTRGRAYQSHAAVAEGVALSVAHFLVPDTAAANTLGHNQTRAAAPQNAVNKGHVQTQQLQAPFQHTQTYCTATECCSKGTCAAGNVQSAVCRRARASAAPRPAAMPVLLPLPLAYGSVRPPVTDWAPTDCACCCHWCCLCRCCCCRLLSKETMAEHVGHRSTDGRLTTSGGNDAQGLSQHEEGSTSDGSQQRLHARRARHGVPVDREGRQVREGRSSVAGREQAVHLHRQQLRRSRCVVVSVV